jgi:hypothetical protein
MTDKKTELLKRLAQIADDAWDKHAESFNVTTHEWNEFWFEWPELKSLVEDVEAELMKE